MADVDLTIRDFNVLEKIKDPESNLTAGISIDSSLPRDPHVTDPDMYQRVVQKERAIIRTIHAIEAQLGQSHAPDARDTAINDYCQCISDLDEIIAEQPRYASARNNRAQVIRRLFGDALLLESTTRMPMPLIEQPDASEKRKAAATALEDLECSIALLSPPTAGTALSPQAARTLSMAHTQHAAIFLGTSKLMSRRGLDLDENRHEARWTKLDFEEAAAQDLACGGRYGNPIDKSLSKRQLDGQALWSDCSGSNDKRISLVFRGLTVRRTGRHAMSIAK